MDFNINITPRFGNACPNFVGAKVYAEIQNTRFSDSLWKEIDAFTASFTESYTTDDIKRIPSIEATRSAYRRCGKDPSRYRPSGEALIRRILKGNSLYQIDTAVDLINLSSMKFGYSIGGFDADKIEGTDLTLDIGQEGEPYEGIGRGELNIAGLPVYRDSIGGIGTPTSDNERTKIGLSTTRLLIIINGYDGNKENVAACAEFTKELLCQHASCNLCEISFFQYF